MKRQMHRASPGGTIIITLITLCVLSMMAAYALTRVLPRLRMAYQNAAWEEARLASEAGVDAAMGDLLRNAAGPSPGTWPGWKQTTNGVTGPANPGVLGVVGNVVGSVLSLLLGGGGNAVPGPAIAVSQPIFLDNLNVAAGSGIPTEVDVQLWALYPSAAPQTRWFRIRSMATCGLPPEAYEAEENLDAPLRRLSLHNMRPQLRRNDVGQPTSIPLPNVSRTVEVLVQPILPFELALWTQDTLSFGLTGSWCVDSYDSRDPLKSSAGAYPGRNSPLVQQNGHVASNRTRPASDLYGPLIATNGMRVRGAVATNGGDDPATDAHENVSGALAVDPARIRSDFCREMNPVAPPSGISPQAPPASGPYRAGSYDAPAYYSVPGDLGDFRLSAPADGSNGLVVIIVNGGLTLTQALIVPPKVTAVLYVNGNIDISDNVNSGTWSNNLPANFMVFGQSSGPRQTLRVHGSAALCACFYGPAFDITLDGSVDWCGSLAGNSFAIADGGDGGVHYDEALAGIGPAVSFRIARYVEDVRE